ncbi:MAG: ribbon-helix-helix domain-containing protein [Candidatus Diapherotrites archaeon]|nr:ribbon-helix-helix domain-containing protein [Candidatus Diapherotrites archaeon]
MTMISVDLKEPFLKDLNAFIKKSGQYTSRSEFIKEAIRKNMQEAESKEWRKRFHKAVEEMREKAYANGFDGKLLTREERARIADKFIKENNITLI